MTVHVAQNRGLILKQHNIQKKWMMKQTSTFLLCERFFSSYAAAAVVVVVTSIQQMLIVALCFDYIKIFLSRTQVND